MTTLVVGASGATGRKLVEQLLNQGQQVRAIVRSPETLPTVLKDQDNLSLVQASILDLSDAEMAQYVEGCDAIASCLGHNLNFKGIFGHPRHLVTDATRRLCNAVKANKPTEPVRFVLMNTTGNRNRDLEESISFSEKCVVGLIRLLVPPHRDNEQAADYLRVQVGQQDSLIEWAAVRPDTLVNEDQVSEYEVHPSPTRSAIFDAGKTSRINVGHFMAELITDDELWNRWQGQMPVIYNRESS
ncbi:MAG: SDR family oxidoreductase [Gammaproteobacteria bacterium]|nr:SDR family oxidoreductase [Gammaproteobacteria bacterium]MBT8437865.1 SDR family oxidoreductase [Gammaproteobacteria bacterium]